MNEIIKTLENDVFKHLNFKYRKEKIIEKYFHNSSDVFDEKIIMLWPFVETMPFKYIDGAVYETISKFIDKNKVEFQKSLQKYNHKFTKSILAFRNINPEMRNEDPVKDLSPKNVYLFDTVYHPEYTRNIESVFGHLVDIFIDTLNQITPNKNYRINGDLSIKLKILKSNKLGVLTKYCDTFIRNSISHGSFYYEMNEIKYMDKKREKLLYPYKFISMLDNLQNTIATIFFCIFLMVIDDEDKSFFKNNNLPLGIIFNYLSSILEHNLLDYLYVIESRLQNNKNQIIFELKAGSKSRNWMTIECFKLAYHLNSRFNHKYDRLGIHIDNGDSVKSSMFINLRSLDQDIATGDFAKLSNSMENSMLWHDESKLIRRIKTWKNILFYSKYNAINDFYAEFYTKMELVDYKKYFIIKQIEDRSSVNTGRIFLHIVIIKEIQFLLDEIELFIEFIHYIVKKNRKNMKLKVVGINDRTKSVKPIYIWGALYRQDIRIRNLDTKQNKICDFEWIHKSKEQKPILLKNTEKIKGLRIKFNEL